MDSEQFAANEQAVIGAMVKIATTPGHPEQSYAGSLVLNYLSMNPVDSDE